MLSLQTITVSVAIAGALSAYAGYGKFKKSRCGDLRGEVYEERESLRSVIEALPAQLERAKRSPSGSPESIRQRLSELEVDLLEAKLLGVELPDIDYADLSAGELELRLIEILALSLRASALADKYGTVPAENTGPDDILELPDSAAESGDFSAQPAMSLAAP
jgi:hypothetical protein